MGKKAINLILRGHIRSSFGDGRLKGLVDRISDAFDVGIYIQTWNIVQNGLSWRRLHAVEDVVTEERVVEYLGNDRIRDIKILDDSKIRHHGNTEGRIGRTPCPVLAWKNMYYGKFVASKSVLDKEDPKSVNIQMRFDILSNPFSPNESELMEYFTRERDFFEGDDQEESIRFLRMRCFLGVDNVYMANAEDMHRFISYMYYDMDRILHFHRRTIHQEHIAFHERKSFKKWSMPGDLVDGPATAEEGA